MKCTIVFVSPNGTTKASAKLLKEEFERDSQTVELFDIGRGELRYDFNPVIQALKASDIAAFCAPAYHMDMLAPMRQLFSQLRKNRGSFHCTGLLVLTYAGITSGNAFLNASRSLQKAGVQVAGALKISAPHFHHKARFPTNETYSLVRDFYHQLKAHQYKPLSPTRAHTILKPEKKRVTALYPLVHLIGKKRELPISIDQNLCRLCKKCATECPVGAISVTDKNISIAQDTCIHCYHCTIACPVGAITIPVEKLDQMIAKNKRIVGTEQPADKVYI